MSEVVHYTGTLHGIKKLENETLEEQCKRVLDNKELDEFYDSYKEMLLQEYYKEFVEHDGVLYKVVKEIIDPDGDIFKMSKTDDGVIHFEVRYYNGGCGFDEAIEEAFANIK